MGKSGDWGLWMLALFSCLLWACREPDTHIGRSLDLPYGRFRDGDLAFRRGGGLTSRAVLAADAGGVYSHVGLLKREGDEWFVIHAVPGEPVDATDVDRVKCEPVDRFFAADRAVCGAVMRVKADSFLCAGAACHAGRLALERVLFDHDYDLADTTRLYCTELVDFVYRTQGIDLPEGRISRIQLPGFHGDFLLPSDLFESGKLDLLFEF